MSQLEELVQPTKITGILGNLYDGNNRIRTPTLIRIDEDGRISDVVTGGKELEKYDDHTIVLGEHEVMLPAAVSLHNHGRDCVDILPTDNRSQTHKEDSFTLSLALMQGGAAYGTCMPNLPVFLDEADVFDRQLTWINRELAHRKKPIIPLGMYALIRPQSKPFGDKIMYKLLWNTFGPTNFENDEQVRETLKHYTGHWVTAHCETIADMIQDDSLAHHEKRPITAAINAVQLFLECAREYKFHPHIAHISSVEEIKLVEQYNDTVEDPDLKATYEITPQAITLNNETYSSRTGLDQKFGQQNPPLRSKEQMTTLRSSILDGKGFFFATDHAPHTIAEKEQGISGMPQASTATQVYAYALRKIGLSSDDILHILARRTALKPGQYLEHWTSEKRGKIEPGYPADIAILRTNDLHTIGHEQILSKCRWTPYSKIELPVRVLATSTQGNLYTQAALRNAAQ